MSTDKKQTVIWYGDPEAESDMFVMPVPNVEAGVAAIRTLNAFNRFTIDTSEEDNKELSGGLALMSEDGHLEPWSYVDIEADGRMFTDPMEYLQNKYERTTIIT
jgi:hypothetical protein